MANHLALTKQSAPNAVGLMFNSFWRKGGVERALLVALPRVSPRRHHNRPDRQANFALLAAQSPGFVSSETLASAQKLATISRPETTTLTRRDEIRADQSGVQVE